MAHSTQSVQVQRPWKFGGVRSSTVAMELAEAPILERYDILQVTCETPFQTSHMYCLSVTPWHQGLHPPQCPHTALNCLHSDISKDLFKHFKVTGARSTVKPGWK